MCLLMQMWRVSRGEQLLRFSVASFAVSRLFVVRVSALRKCIAFGSAPEQLYFWEVSKRVNLSFPQQAIETV